MRCPHCETENRAGAKFCRKCGAELTSVCMRCGAELPLDAEFCDACGAALPAQSPLAPPDTISDRLQRLIPKEYAERLLATRGQPHDERRTVTFLFSDVKGSTAMAEKLDPEDVKEIMDGAFEFVIPPIFLYEGTLTQLMGDAILAFFGAPIAHEDDPERAMRAALDIIAGAKRYAAKLEQERGIKGFNVRVGVNTGLVVVGELGSDLRVAYTAIGDAINLAARMETAAEPGTILITEATHKLIAPLFETESLGRIEVKGKAEPVAVYRVLAAKYIAGKVRGIPGLESPLVGREEESAALREAVERLRAGAGGVVTIVGEAGIGKSRLVAEARKVLLPQRCHSERSEESPQSEDEILRVAQDDNMVSLHWIEGRCLSYGSSIAYQLWLDVLRALMGVTLDEPPEAVGNALRRQVQQLCAQAFDDVYPYLGRLMSLPLEDNVVVRLDELDGQELKSRTFQAVQTLVECAASERPLVLVCEDLHWADPTSMELLTRMLVLPQRVPLLMLCVFRPVKDHACWRLRDTVLEAYPAMHTDLVLSPLTASESHTLVANLLKVEDLPQALRDRILDRAEGNPFYVEEVIRSLIDRGAIAADEATGRWTATQEVATIPIPDTLQGVLMARIDRLQEGTKRVLQMAAVIGRIFLYRVLAAIAKEERQLDDQLRTLQYQEMIRERSRIPELEYIFKHDLTREAAYNGLLKKERRAFHRQVGQALEKLFPERVEEQLGLLAHHWERSGDAEKAVHYLQRAGDAARLMYSHEEAIDYYHRALAVLAREQDLDQAARTWMKIGLTHHGALNFQASRAAYEEGFALWRTAQTRARPALKPSPQAFRIPFTDTEWAGVFSSEGQIGEVPGALLSGLVRHTLDWEVVPDVAHSWETLEGGRRYIFHLRDNVRWSDGEPVTAQDFQCAWQWMLDPDHGLAKLLYDVVGARLYNEGATSDPGSLGVRPVDDLTLEVELEKPTGYFPHLVSRVCGLPIPRHVFERYGDSWHDWRNLVTNGPFQVADRKPGEPFSFVRNPLYHGGRLGNVERVELRAFSDHATLLPMYEAGDVDALIIRYSMPLEHRLAARRRHAGERLSARTPGAILCVFNTGRPPFDDLRVRQAFVLGTDREVLCDLIWGGYPLPATGGLVPPGMPGHVPGLALPYDRDAAAHLLQEAGFPRGKGFPQVKWLAPPSIEQSLHHLQNQWRTNLGVDLAWEELPWSEYYERVYDERPNLSFSVSFADYPDPNCIFADEFPWAITGWHNETCAELVERARRLLDHGARMKLYAEVERIVVREAPIMPLLYLRYEWLVKPWVKNYPGQWKDVIIDPH